ncbi:MAG: hypothetical protein IAG13_31795 [Deltaproteobacteria bacterium]|nr:hypothetical protein [Nannocystaceae bacterium]
MASRLARMLVAVLGGTPSACMIVGDLGRDSGSADGSGDAGEGSDGGDGGVDTKLPMLPELTNVRVRIVGDAANVAFDPIDAAVDYRIYPLPPDDAIDIGEDGTVVVDRALYRCAGQREALYMLIDTLDPDPGWNDNAAGGATLVGRDVVGVPRSEPDAELGHVYLEQGPDRLPVYALGDPDVARDGTASCGRPVFEATRSQRYTTDSALRDQLLGEHWRDDGIAFWVPAVAGADTRAVREGSFGADDALLRWIDGPEGDARGAGTTIFEVLREPNTGTAPLMRVHVAPYCGRPHDTLVATRARYRQTLRQADQPLPALRWSGMQGPSTLVLEALDSGCPYQGNLSPEHEPAFQDAGIAYPEWVTPDQMRERSATGEVFVDGQHEGQPWPRAIARSFVEVAPALPPMDFHASFPVDAELRTSFAVPTGDVYGQHFEGTAFSLSSYGASRIHFGSLLGELWLAYADIGAGVNASVRLTAKAPAQVSAAGFLHVTAEVDLVTTDRRFPQILVSDQAAPVQDNLALGTTLIVAPRGYAPGFLDVQLCDHRGWDLGNECPRLPTFDPSFAPSVRVLGETAGSDTSVQIDLYLSSSRIYLLTNGVPYSCTDLPALADDGNAYAPPLGAVTVTWGDVLAHSAIDFTTGGGAITAPDSYAFHRAHLQTTTRRRFDNLGFSSGVGAPPWDEARVPCVGG